MKVAQEDDRVRRRNLESVTTGLGMGAGVGVLVGSLAGALVPPVGFVFAGIGGLAGGVLGKLVGSRVSPEEWDPPPNRGPYVGAYSPDDDIASTAADSRRANH
jgi:hypothetical protein